MSGFLSWALADYGINAIIDVGANEGQFVERIRRLGYNNQIFSFEPVPSTFDALQKRVGDDPRWTGYNIALGSENAEIEIWHSPAHTDMSSIHRIEEAVPTRFKSWSESESRKISVKMSRLDDAKIPLKGDQSTRLFIKSDTQGHDIEVLKGASNLLERTELIMIEAAVLNLYQDAPDIVGSLSALKDFGFAPIAFFPVTSLTKNSIPVIEFDVIACKLDVD